MIENFGRNCPPIGFRKDKYVLKNKTNFSEGPTSRAIAVVLKGFFNPKIFYQDLIFQDSDGLEHIM